MHLLFPYKRLSRRSTTISRRGCQAPRIKRPEQDCQRSSSCDAEHDKGRRLKNTRKNEKSGHELTWLFFGRLISRHVWAFLVVDLCLRFWAPGWASSSPMDPAWSVAVSWLADHSIGRHCHNSMPGSSILGVFILGVFLQAQCSLIARLWWGL